jgi:hypothetical protein
MDSTFDFHDPTEQITLDLELSAFSGQPLAPEKHLSSPITVSLLDRLLVFFELYKRKHVGIAATGPDPNRETNYVRLMQENPNLSYSGIKKPLADFAESLKFCLKDPQILTARDYPLLFQLSTKQPHRLKADYQLARDIFKKELAAYLDLVKDVLKPAEIEKLRYSVFPGQKLSRHAVESSQRAKLWDTIVDDYRMAQARYHRKSKTSYCDETLKVVYCSGFVLLKHVSKDFWWLATYEQLQMIQDCTASRHNVEVSLDIKFHNGNENLRKQVHRLLKWQEDTLVLHGNDGYEIVKAPEAVFKAWINTLTEGDLLLYTSYERTLDKIKTKEKKIGNTTRMVDRLDLFVRSIADISNAAELFGLAKLSGHPTVFAEKSAAAVRTESLPDGTFSMLAVRQMTRMFKHIVLSGYIDRHSDWPNMRCLPPRGSILRRHYNNRVTSLPLNSYHIAELDGVEFGKFIEFDYSEDYLKFLDDKAICPGASETPKFWFGQKVETRRLLQKILEVQHFDTRELVERLRHSAFTLDELIVELTQKERELKVAARCYCKLPFAVRTFFTLTEYNLGEHFMSKYMPQQTMTMSNTEVRSRLYNMVRSSQTRNKTLLEVDFSRWNLRWRDISVLPIAMVLEDIFGLPGVFSQAHPFFSKATIVLTDKHSLPAGASPSIPINLWPESDLLWRGHQGGFEGIQQKLWTICTIAMMYYVFHDQNVSFLMAGQGDNQIFAITFDVSTESAADQLRRLLSIMETRCFYLNHEVKPDECIDSSTVLTYSKEIYVKGVHTLYNLKFAARTLKVADSDIPSLSTEVAGVNATAIACADTCKHPVLSIFWKTFQLLRLLSYRAYCPIFRTERNSLLKILNDPLLAEFVILVPGSLGGLPMQTWGRFFMKGETDDLSWDVAAVKRLLPYSSALAADFKMLVAGAYKPRNPNLTNLILDPKSIPIMRPKDQKRLIKESISAILPGITKNKWIADILNSSVSSAGDSLLLELSKTQPLYPKIMSDVYAYSPAGVRDSLMARFTMTRTVAQITQSSLFTDQIAQSNVDLLSNLIVRYRAAIKVRDNSIENRSAFEICQILRSHWGPTVKHENIGAYCPLDYLLVDTPLSNSVITASCRVPVDTLCDSVGFYPPNFGTKTRQKISDHGYKVITSSSTAGDLRALCITASELQCSNELKQLFNDIITARSPYDMASLEQVMPSSYGGAAAHRHDQLNTASYSILGSKTVPTHLNFCSDLAGELSGGENDYPVVFQEYYLYLTSIFQTLSSHKILSTPKTLGVEIPSTLVPLPNDAVALTSYKPIKWPVLENNALCYLSYLQLAELPSIPPRRLIPHTNLEDCNTGNLICSYLLNKTRLPRTQLKDNTTLVMAPFEMLDLKEFNHCELGVLLKGCAAYVVIEALYHSIRTAASNAHVELHEFIVKIAHHISAGVTRLMLHPTFRTSQYASQHGILLRPGMGGSLSAAKSFQGCLIERCYTFILHREILSDDFKVFFFEDISRVGISTMTKLAYALVACRSNDFNKFVISMYNKLQIDTASSIARQLGDTAAATRLIYNAVEDIYRKASRTGSHSSLGLNGMKIAYVHSSANEAIRILREKQKVPRVPRKLQAPIYSTASPNTGRVRWRKTYMDGQLCPNHKCPTVTADDRKVELFLGRLVRPYGLYSTASSVWSNILGKERKLIRNRIVVSIGVGHGAVASVCLNLGCSSVVGVDLRDSFPIVTQREETYKPPEVVNTGLSDQFSWSPMVYSMGGDALRNPELTWSSCPANSTVIIDIERPHLELVPLLLALPPNLTVILRLVLCEEWLRFYIDTLNPKWVICTTIQVDMHNKSYIFCFNGSDVSLYSGNYDRVEIDRIARYTPSLARSQDSARERWNLTLRWTGINLSMATLNLFDNTLEQLNRWQFNSNDIQYRDSIANLAESIRISADWIRTYPTKQRHDILAIPDSQFRLVSYLISNSIPWTLELLDRLSNNNN